MKAAILLLALMLPVSAAEIRPGLDDLVAINGSIDIRHQRPGPITCTVVRDFVAMVGAEKAERMAREAGATEERLAAARRCLKDGK